MGGRIRTMEICKQALGGRCTRGADECKFAHVTKDGHVTINPDNTVTICRESLSDKCQRETCKFWHPPAHLRDSASAVCDMAKSRMRGGMGGRPMVSMQGSEMDIRAELQQIQQQEMGLQQQKQQIAQQEQMLMQRKQQLSELLGGGTPQQPPLMQQPAAAPYPQYGEPPVQQYHEPAAHTYHEPAAHAYHEPVPQYREPAVPQYRE